MAITIKDVARKAGVSVASVSRALNGHDSVTPETRQRIQKVAKALNYTPHSAARSLITRRTDTIGAILPDLYGEFFSELIRGIDLAARAGGLHLLVSSSHGDAKETAAALRAMLGRVDGVLVMSPHVDAELLSHNLPPALPAVLLNTPVDGAHYAALRIDNHAGALAMTRHLISAGHRRITFVGGPVDNFDAAERERGYREAMAEAGLDTALLDGDFSEESGYRAGQAVARAPRRPDAVFAANDTMAVGCLFALAEAGLRVPAQLAVAGFDDIPLARFLAPPLTTMRVHIAELGRRATQALLATLQGAEVAPHQLLVPELVVRDSCAAPPRGSAA